MPTRAVRRTKAEPQPCAAAGHMLKFPKCRARQRATFRNRKPGVAAHRGFEPRLTLSESVVLPVERMGIECGRRDSNAQAARFELARSSEIAVTSAYAAGDSNPDPTE